jgi:SAM-dependent methyltransferase
MLRRSLITLTLPLALIGPALHAQVAEEVPFITTPDNVTLAMLQLAQVGPRDRVIDLGSGDGRIVITAARRFGASGLGVEIVPELVARSRAAAEQAGVAQRTEFREQDLFKTDLSGATVITMYLLPEVNLQLRPALLQLAPGTRIVSHDWDMGDWLPDETLTVDAPDKKIGREKKSRLHRWVVPARAEGLWCGRDGTQLRVTQRYQMVQAQWRLGDREWALQGRLDGRRLRLVGAAPGALQAMVEDDSLVLDRPGPVRGRAAASAAAAGGVAPLRRVSGPECRG